MACFSGKDGSLKFDKVTIGRVRNWSLNGTLETLDTTSLGQIAREFCAGLKTATGSATIWYHTDNNIKEILDHCITNSGTPTSGELELIWGNKSIKGNVYINSATITCNTGEVMSADVSFQMTGDYLTATL